MTPRCSRWLAATACALLAACGDDRIGERAQEPPAVAPRRVTTSVAVQVGSFADSANAAALHDSLARAGWDVYVRRGAEGGRPLLRVRLAPTNDVALLRFVASALREQGLGAVVIRDSAVSERPPVVLIAVNTGAPGMAAGTRWALSPDSRALIAVEDQAAVENEPHPDGFVFASEAGEGYHFQMDSVWDVAPSPNWRRLAAGRAFTVVATGPGGITDERWRALAHRAGLSLEQVRRQAFESSSMNVAFGIARPELLMLPAIGTGGEARIEARPIPIAAGWRVGWSADGSTIAVGSNPVRRSDDAPPAAWLAVDPKTLASLGTLPPDTRLDDPGWLEGPVLDISLPIDMRGRRTVSTEGEEIVSEGGWIRVGGRTIGPGIALAATRSGRYLLALAPRPSREPFDTPTQLVLYSVGQP